MAPTSRVKCAALLFLCGCAFAQRHPGITAGIAGGSIGFVSCEMDAQRVGTCAEIGAIVGAGLGLITGIVTTVFDTGDHSLSSYGPDDEELPQEPEIKRPVRHADAGVDAAPPPPVDAAPRPVDAPPPVVDAGLTLGNDAGL